MTALALARVSATDAFHLGHAKALDQLRRLRNANSNGRAIWKMVRVLRLKSQVRCQVSRGRFPISS